MLHDCSVVLVCSRTEPTADGALTRSEHRSRSPLREYCHGGRLQGLEDKLDRIITDVEGLLSDISDIGSNFLTKKKRTVAMCRHIYDLSPTVGMQPIPRRDIYAAIESVMGNLSDYLKETYTPLDPRFDRV